MAAGQPRAFFDTNVLVYLSSADSRADRARSLLLAGGTISVQVLNEFVQVSRSKGKRSFDWIIDALSDIRTLCPVEPITVAAHDRAVDIARQYGFHIYDATIVASALIAKCDTLYTEDLQHGQVIEQQLRVVNPFV